MPPPELQSTDRVNRFLYNNNEFNADTRTVRASVFANRAPYGFSVFKTTGLNGFRIWNLGLRNGRQGVAVLARFELSVRHYLDSGLSFERTAPRPRHFDISGMPISNDIIDSATRLTRRLELVRDADLQIFPKTFPPQR